jgi:beta-lactam-binding protein with PASTA domain
MWDKWEYEVQDVAGMEYEDIRAKLNEYGAEGWELVCTTETEESVCTLWLKRRKL